MRSYLLQIFLPLFISLSVLIDCGGLRELDRSTPMAEDEREMTFYFDWSEMDEKPTGMTVLLYPESGGEPYKYVSNIVDSLVVTLPYQNYKVIVFNQTVEEFSTVGFRNLESWETAEAYEPETPIDPSSRKINTSVRMKSNSVASAACEATLPAMARSVIDSTKQYVKPLIRVHPMSITVYVKGLEYVNSLTSSISGLSSGFLLGKEQLTDTELVQELEDWDFHPSQASGQPGYVTISFGVWGIKSVTDDAESTSSPVTLDMNFTLNNGEKVEFTFDVKKYITVINDTAEGKDEAIVVDVTVGTDMPDNTPPLEIVPTEGGLNVTPWNRPTDVDVKF